MSRDLGTARFMPGQEPAFVRCRECLGSGVILLRPCVRERPPCPSCAGYGTRPETADEYLERLAPFLRFAASLCGAVGEADEPPLVWDAGGRRHRYARSADDRGDPSCLEQGDDR